MKNDSITTLEVGKFYWALPVFDPDTDHDWENQPQPARFDGYNEHNQERWLWIASENYDWPSRWHGEEIVP